MRLGAFTLVAFFTVFSQCDSAELEVRINNDEMRTRSCVGENITYVCNVDSNLHSWSAGTIFTLQGISSTSASEIPVGESGFTLRRLSDDGTRITSSLSVIAFSDLNGVMIECFSGGQDPQTATADVVGAPTLSVLQNSDNITSFDLRITSPTVMPECVSGYNYTSTVTDNMDTVQDVVMLNETSSSSFTESGFDVCKYTYSFTAANILFDGIFRGDQISEVEKPTTNFAVAAPITGLVNTSDDLVWSAPANAMGCSFQYIASNQSGFMNTTTDTNIRVNFPTCLNQTLTVTPVVPITGQVLTSSSDSINIFILDDTFVSMTPNVDDVIKSVRSGGEVDITIKWTPLDIYNVSVTRGDGGGDRVVVHTGINTGEHIVEDCNYEETNITFYVRFISDDCLSKESSGSIAGLACTGEREGESAGGGINIGAVVGGIIAAIVVAVLIVILICVICYCMKKKSGKSDEDGGNEPKVTYHSAGATPADGYGADPSGNDGPGLYADPKSIKHEAAGPGGEEYALVTTKKRQPDPVSTGDLYSVPDKSKKTQNQGLVYADIDVKNPTRPPPAAPRGHAYPPDNEPVMYSTVNT